MKTTLRIIGFLLGIGTLILGAMLVVDKINGRGSWTTSISSVLLGLYFLFYSITGFSDLLGANSYFRRKKP